MALFKQGKPDGDPLRGIIDPLYHVHLDLPHTRRDQLLGRKTARVACNHGGYHMWLTKKGSEVTCPKCKEKINGPE